MQDRQRELDLALKVPVDGVLLGKEEWDAWAASPAGTLFSRYLARKQEELKKAWARGAFGNQVHFETVVMNSVAQGMHQVIDQILDLEFEDIAGEFRE